MPLTCFVLSSSIFQLKYDHERTLIDCAKYTYLDASKFKVMKEVISFAKVCVQLSVQKSFASTEAVNDEHCRPYSILENTEERKYVRRRQKKNIKC